MILQHYDDAINDLEYIKSKFPNEPIVQEKLQKAKAERKKKNFLKSIDSGIRPIE